MKLENKIAFVTGASSGMGHAIALKFAAEGATVIAVARRKEKLDALVAEASGLAGKIVAKSGDVADFAGITKVLDDSFAEFGKIDILVNNAGVMDEMMPVAECSDELWEKVLDTNLKGPFVICRRWLNGQLENGGGVIINTASIGGIQGARAGASYTASKFGIVGLTKNIAFMYAQKGIRCNAIAPGGVATEIAVGLKSPSKFGSERASSGMGANPRYGSADEIAGVALFLASDDSSFVNGAVITADGGWSAY
ncbi:MAG: SDR family oxidoreductase [Oscillospiraceae bacterium]|jgi:NAD(P)-dependent dehydrogenase (short-subunit alcohol dehydrogenase family)|nr:SDR family oxidoreductase [Oscillospiraceae bacterium]